jgi:hypothetical protein
MRTPFWVAEPVACFGKTEGMATGGIMAGWLAGVKRWFGLLQKYRLPQTKSGGR